jgi:hypothetical protein
MFRNKPFNTDMQGAFRPLHFVAKIVGLACYTFIRNTQNGEETINISWKYNRSSVIWSLLLLTVGTVAALCTITQNLIKNSASLSGLFSSLLEIPLIYASGLVPIISGLTAHRIRMLQLVTKLSTVDKCLNLHSDNIYKKHKAKVLILLVCFIVFIVPIYGLFIYFWDSDGILYGVLLILADFISLINDIGTVNTVILLQERLSILNKNIESLFIAESRSYTVANTPSECVVRSRRYRLLTASHLGNVSEFVEQSSVLQHQNIQNLEPMETMVASYYRSKITEIIVTYRKIYQKLYDICCLINSMCGFSLLLSTLSYTLRFVSHVYNAIHILLMSYSSKGSLVSKQVVALLVISSLITSMRIILVTLSCHKTCEEYKNCIDIIQELLLRSDQKDIIQQLKLFSSQLENNRIEFTANGFFVVNLSLLTTLTGVTVTYIILLIQI